MTKQAFIEQLGDSKLSIKASALYIWSTAANNKHPRQANRDVDICRLTERCFFNVRRVQTRVRFYFHSRFLLLSFSLSCRKLESTLREPAWAQIRISTIKTKRTERRTSMRSACQDLRNWGTRLCSELFKTINALERNSTRFLCIINALTSKHFQDTTSKLISHQVGRLCLRNKRLETTFI